MGKGWGGVPLGQRPTFTGGVRVDRQAKTLPLRHVWITGPDGTGPHPGLVLQWERRGSGADSWWALCVWVVVDDGATVLQWLPARKIRPV